jgi:chromosomal replication initiator protein
MRRGSEQKKAMTRIDAALWRDMMEDLRTRHAPICRQWFEELEPGPINSGLLEIYTRNSVQQNYLQKKCVDQFTEAAQAATGALVAVRFVSGDQRPAATPGTAPGQTASPDTAAKDNGEARRPKPRPRMPGQLPRFGAAYEQRPQYFDDQMVLIPDYSFENFVQGPNNRMAYAAARAVAEQPGENYNPLFIHGGVGLGKTHILQSICQEVLQQNPDAYIIYMSCDAFINHFIESVQSGNMNEFRHRFRDADLLVIDDIHFLTNREQTQEEFFHTFNALYQCKRQIVLSSDSPPAEIPQLEERLVSRFGWGLVTKIDKPPYETRVAIVQSKMRLRNIDCPDDVVCYIASKVDTNTRELEGAITTIQGHAQLTHRRIDLALAQEALGEPALQAHTSQVTLQNIIDLVTAFYNVKLSDLQSKRRHKSITMPRQVCMYLARKRTRFSLQEIGGYFGGRDHTTVMHSIRTVEERVQQDAVFAGEIQVLEERITRGM